MTSVQLSIVPPPLQYGPLSSNSNADSNLTYLNEKFVTIQEPPPKPRPQDQVRPDLPIPVPTDKPAGCYLILQRSRSVNKQSGPQTIRPLPERKGGSKFAFGCLPNKQPRAGPQYPAPSTTRRQDNIKPPAAKQPLRSKFGYYPIYERSPGLVESLKQQTTLTSKSTAKVPPPPVLVKNPRRRYPDYELP